MSAPVDVLAVLDRQIEHTRQFGGSPSFQTMQETRDAVAELIVHNTIMRNALVKLACAPGCGCHPVCRCGEGEWTRYELEGRMDEAQAALNRVGGAK